MSSAAADELATGVAGWRDYVKKIGNGLGAYYTHDAAVAITAEPVAEELKADLRVFGKLGTKATFAKMRLLGATAKASVAAAAVAWRLWDPKGSGPAAEELLTDPIMPRVRAALVLAAADCIPEAPNFHTYHPNSYPNCHAHGTCAAKILRSVLEPIARRLENEKAAQELCERVARQKRFDADMALISTEVVLLEVAASTDGDDITALGKEEKEKKEDEEDKFEDAQDEVEGTRAIPEL
jgi:hypothetical protein